MLLFGGTLVGAKQATGKPQPQIQPPVDSGNAAHVLTPHTDVLHRLTNHELRLLEELERTRAKLQAEWRLKVAAFEREQAASGGLLQHDLQSVMHSRTMELSPSQKAKSFLKHKLPHETLTASLPRLPSKMDVLPVLTTVGETAFEIGLDAQDKQAHILPIFRLPIVNVNATASAMTVKQVETLEEDRDRKQASETLGLSLEEIDLLEAQLAQSRSVNPASSIGLNQLSPGRMEHKLPGLSRHQNIKPKRDHAALSSSSSKKNRNARLERSDSLRKQLASALGNVQQLTRLVRDDIYLAQRICPASDLRTSLCFKRWGRDKVESIFRRLLFNLQGLALEKWRQVVENEKQQEKLQAYLMYKGSKKLDVFLLNWSQRKLRQAWTKWWSDVVHIKALERAQLELDAIRVLQRAWRGYSGRLFASLVRMQKQFTEQTNAAVKLQRLFRGSITRKFFRMKRAHQQREAAVIRIQTLARGFIARQRARELREERRRHLAAAKLQALYRGRKARQRVTALRRDQKVSRAAALIQRRYRGRLGRAQYIRRRMELYHSAAAVKIQRIGRGRLARNHYKRLREEDRQLRALQNHAATQIQKIYRGHRARLATELKLLALKEKNRWKARAAIKIQKAVRCRQARRHVDRLRAEHVARLVALARLWVECWDDDASTWYYYNQETGDSIAAPPSTGYTKSDGNLVLQTGKVIPDPQEGDLPVIGGHHRHDSQEENKTDGAAGEAAQNEVTTEEDEEDEEKLCVECEEEDARRKCDQCEDYFCGDCYDKLHHSAKRGKHTWKAVGPIRCIECDKMKATRWCYVCQDPYCLGCFTIIHAKGNKATHDWTDMAAFRKAKKQQQAEEENAQTYDEFMQSNEYQYVNELTADESVASSSGQEGEWATMYDEASGQYYYYNSYTGESRWA